MRSSVAIIGLLSVLGLVGCGGSSPVSAPPETYASKFMGNYLGSWSNTLGESGTAIFSVDSTGAVSGNVQDQKTLAIGTLNGVIGTNGEVSVTGTYPTSAAFSSTGVFTKTAAGGIFGNLTGSTGSLSVTDGYSLSANGAYGGFKKTAGR